MSCAVVRGGRPGGRANAPHEVTSHVFPHEQQVTLGTVAMHSNVPGIDTVVDDVHLHPLRERAQIFGW